MNVLLLNTYRHGGAGIACRRLREALQGTGVNADLLTVDDTGSRWPFYAERLSFLPFERDKSVRFSFSLANFGKDLSRHPLVQKADVIHLHWINQGLLSLSGIEQLARLGKPFVWTLHDMWAFTGGCHYSRGCEHYKNDCGQCPYLRVPAPNDLSHRIWLRKKKLYPAHIQFVTCSEWLADVARSSGLLRDFPIRAIPNPIDTGVFSPASPDGRAAFRAAYNISPNAFLLLFVAMNVQETRKGFSFLLESLKYLHAQNTDIQLEILVLGKSDPQALAALPYPVHALGMVREPAELSKVYGAADVFVIPSLEDNLPNTVMESLSCGTPVVGFNTGGIPEMVTHGREGFIAQQGDFKGLAAGVLEVLQGKTSIEMLRKAARAKVETHYSSEKVAGMYTDLYRKIL